MFNFIISLFKNERRGSSCVKLNDKTFLVDGEIVSFDPNRLELIRAQKQEDDNIFFNYVNERKKYDREYIQENVLSTYRAMFAYSTGLKMPKSEDLEKIQEDYEKYVSRCSILGVTGYLNLRMYWVWKNNMICATIKIFLLKALSPMYMIHHEKTAKYLGGDMKEILAQEFKQKYY